MKQYLLSVHMVEGEEQPPEEVMQRAYRDVEAFNERLRASGEWVFAGGLHPANTATVVQIKDDEVLTTDGPYAEAKERIAGFWIVRAADLDRALALAADGSRACGGPVEVRPFEDEPGD
ncbi:MAG: YciI family protein [Mycobacteriales bacterium]|nr:MAG: hypothetical protein DLM56_04895 [Pseudonocardiales bacterium]